MCGNAFCIIVYFNLNVCICRQAIHLRGHMQAGKQLDTGRCSQPTSGFIQALLMTHFNHELLGDKVILALWQPPWWRLVEVANRLCPDRDSEVMSTEEKIVILPCLVACVMTFPWFLFQFGSKFYSRSLGTAKQKCGRYLVSVSYRWLGLTVFEIFRSC
jgi:hypothetical protein